MEFNQSDDISRMMNVSNQYKPISKRLVITTGSVRATSRSRLIPCITFTFFHCEVIKFSLKVPITYHQLWVAAFI